MFPEAYSMQTFKINFFFASSFPVLYSQLVCSRWQYWIEIAFNLEDLSSSTLVYNLYFDLSLFACFSFISIAILRISSSWKWFQLNKHLFWQNSLLTKLHTVGRTIYTHSRTRQPMVFNLLREDLFLFPFLFLFFADHLQARHICQIIVDVKHCQRHNIARVECI